MNDIMYNEVMKMLGDGKEMVDIAQTITDAMNKAQTDYTAKAKAEAAKAKVKARKMELVNKMCEAVDDYVHEFAPELAVIMDADDSDTAGLVYEALEAFLDEMNNLSVTLTKDDANSITEVKVESADDVLMNFIHNLGL